MPSLIFKEDTRGNIVGLKSGFIISILVTISIIILFLIGFRWELIDAGNTGIRFNKAGSNKGISQENIVTGLVFYCPLTTRIIEYPTYNQRVVWSANPQEGVAKNEEITFQTRDNVPVSMDMSVNYTLLAHKVPKFYEKFRADKIEYFTHGFMRDQVRNAANQIGSEYLFDDVNGIKKEEFLQRLNDQLAKAVGDYGIETGKGSLSLIGAFRVPDNLRNAIGARVQAIQEAIKAENELRVYKANAAKAVAQAEGEAAAMKAKSASITSQFMELKKLEIQQEWVHKWNGKMPDTMLSSGSNTLFQLPVK